jgi:hypothetical protein
MRNRHLHVQLRRVAATIGVAAAAAMASALTLAPAAMADDASDVTTEPADPPAAQDPPPPADPPAPPETPADPSTEDPADPPADDPADEESGPAEVQKLERQTQEKRSTEAVAAAVEPDFGYNKFRVGVQIDDGSWVPPGTTTLGSQITITETGPGVPGGTQTQTCTTSIVDPVDATTTYCDLDDLGPFPDSYEATFGDSVTITQTTVNDGLMIVDGTKVDVPSCDPEEDGLNCAFNAGDILLTDAGLPPEAADDEVCVDPGEPVRVDVLANDDTVNGAPLSDVEITLDPTKGTASVVGSGDDREVRFAPDTDFSGSDSLEYRITTPNGSADATVDITKCPEPEGVLPDTGGGDPRILGTGLALVVGGGALVITGGRRRREPSAVG